MMSSHSYCSRLLAVMFVMIHICPLYVVIQTNYSRTLISVIPLPVVGRETLAKIYWRRMELKKTPDMESKDKMDRTRRRWIFMLKTFDRERSNFDLQGGLRNTLNAKAPPSGTSHAFSLTLAHPPHSTTGTIDLLQVAYRNHISPKLLCHDSQAPLVTVPSLLRCQVLYLVSHTITSFSNCLCSCT
ncbi:hypothetical protein BJV78DRAFT_754209 [Lactifluus subvellereus]|nr:hypothetical protein BJV78DRAFT_754209 [Lactifluus subvellereus]